MRPRDRARFVRRAPPDRRALNGRYPAARLHALTEFGPSGLQTRDPASVYASSTVLLPGRDQQVGGIAFSKRFRKPIRTDRNPIYDPEVRVPTIRTENLGFFHLISFFFCRLLDGSKLVGASLRNADLLFLGTSINIHILFDKYIYEVRQ